MIDPNVEGVPELTEEERMKRVERDITQYVDAMRYRKLAEEMGDRKLTNNEVVFWYISMGYAAMFRVAYEQGQEELNRYYAGLKLGYEPSAEECWKHFLEYQETLVLRE